MLAIAFSTIGAATGLVIGILIIGQIAANANNIIGSGTITTTTTNVATQMSDNTASIAKYLNYTRPFIGENVNSTSALVGKQINRMELSLAKAGSPTGTADTGVYHFVSSSSTGNVTQMADAIASADRGVSQQESIVMAMYFRPTDVGTPNVLSAKWQQTINAMNNHTSVNFYGIINPSSGPGGAVNTNGNYTKGIGAIKTAGGNVCGYVASNYANKAQSSFISEVQSYLNFYPNQINCIFVDEMNNTNSAIPVAYYTNITRTMHNMGILEDVCNPGADTRDIYINSCDKIMIEEGNGTVSESRLQGQTATSGQWWHERFPQSNFVYSSYNRPSFNATQAKAYLQNYVSGYYWTNGTGAGCPDSGVWNCVPAYLDSEFVVIENMHHTAGDKLRSASLEYAGPSSSLIGKTISNIRIPIQRVGTVLYGNYSVGVFYNNMTQKAEFGNGYAVDLPTTITTLDFSRPTPYQTFSKLYSVPYNVSSLASRGMFNATGGTTIWAERAALGTALIGKSMNNIEIIMQKEGSPTGTLQAGVFSGTGTLKYGLGTTDVSTIATTAHYYSFTNSTASYTIQTDDRIGVKYVAGGNSANLVRVYEKTVDRFDSTNDYRERWNWDTGAFVSLTGADVIMDINKVTTATVPSTYTIQSGDYIGVYYPYGNTTQYLTTKVDNTAAFDGSNSVLAEQPGIISTTATKDQDLTLVQASVTTYYTTVSKVKDFGTVTVSTLTGSPQNVTLSLGVGDSYTLASGDFVGIRYNQTGLTSSDYVTVVTDTNPADPFDSTNSKYAEFSNSSKSLTYDGNSDINGALKFVTTSTVTSQGSGDPTTVANFNSTVNSIWGVMAVLPVGLFFGLLAFFKRMGMS